ncbi:hypothetical protein [Enhygromyxa salina]|uniref:Uncharacterized protein n=1 Tax=Enhygromyxa salina TaxID=215803 RepID=A0A2S9YQC8_9BACT|nr:hypothetical protein [Enhygromyxa salina]PRQ07286.1 hypothetical protein ENSA7_29940 [Enhygromyxa salina]
MSRLHLPIKDPCHENWDAMSREGEGRRFCESCTKHVHDLSAMTERKARSVLADESAKGRVCVRYTADTAGNINFIPQTTPAPSIWRMTLAAAGMSLALLTGCTDSTPDEVQEDRCVYEIGPWAFTAARGEGTCPSPDEPPDHVLVGEIEIEPEPAPEPVYELKGDIGPEPELLPEVVNPDPSPVRMGKIAVAHPPEPESIRELMGEAPSIEPCDPQIEPARPELEKMGDVAWAPDPDADPGSQ